MRRVLLLKPGVTSSRATLGDYEVWFSRAAGASMHPVELHAGEVPPPREGFDAIVISGSPLSVTAPEEWMVRAADYALEAAEQGTPVLGVCFGHQLLAWRAGGRVERNPKGRELGTVAVTLTEAGRRARLFRDVPAVFEVQATHEDVVTALPPGAEVLAANAFVEVQAYALGERVVGVQFHPEMDAASIRAAIEAPTTKDEDRRRALAKESPWGARLLRNFLGLD